jgi:hypothetical protein
MSSDWSPLCPPVAWGHFRISAFGGEGDSSIHTRYSEVVVIAAFVTQEASLLRRCKRRLHFCLRRILSSVR